MNAVRRSALLFLPALCALTSCGIPTTGVVEAGGPASGAVPTVRVYFVADGALVGISRRTVAPVDVESAVRELLRGPTEAERVKRVTTLLPAATDVPSPAAVPPATDGSDAVAQEAVPTELVKVTERDDRVLLELSTPAGKLADLAAAQLICTAVEAQRVADPGTAPAPVTVTTPAGRHFEGTSADCPGG